MLRELDSKKLQEIIFSFYTLTHLPMSVFSDKYECLCSFGSIISPLCSELRSSKRLPNPCMNCMADACKSCSEAGGSVNFRCHIGFDISVSPIMDGDITLGYVLCEPQIPANKRDAVLMNVERFAKANDLDLARLSELFDPQNEIVPGLQTARFHIMEGCAVHIAKSRSIVAERMGMFVQLKEYIDRNLSEDLSLAAICAALNMSKTTANRYAMKHLNMSIQAYVRNARISKAKLYLDHTTMSIRDIAIQVGIPDYNYFSKVFRAQVGVSPSKYRRKYID